MAKRAQSKPPEAEAKPVPRLKPGKGTKAESAPRVVFDEKRLEELERYVALGHPPEEAAEYIASHDVELFAELHRYWRANAAPRRGHEGGENGSRLAVREGVRGAASRVGRDREARGGEARKRLAPSRAEAIRQVIREEDELWERYRRALPPEDLTNRDLR